MSKPIRVLSYNAKMLPPPFGTRNKKRAYQIIKAIYDQDPLYDIICLQEVFDEGVRDIFDSKLASIYKHRVKKSSDNDLFNEDSGLFFASKYGITAHRFVEFNDSQPFTSDWISDKGIFGALLDVSAEYEKCSLLVCNTHLQSTECYYQVRANQLSQIQKFINKRLKKAADKNKIAALIMGDFNVIGDVGEEYGKMVSLLGYPRDLFREKNPNKNGYTWDGTINKLIQEEDPDDKDKQRLDYIFAYNNIPKADDNAEIEIINRLKCSSCRMVNFIDNKDRDLSDHFGVDAVLTFSL